MHSYIAYSCITMGQWLVMRVSITILRRVLLHQTSCLTINRRSHESIQIAALSLAPHALVMLFPHFFLLANIAVYKCRLSVATAPKVPDHLLVPHDLIR